MLPSYDDLLIKRFEQPDEVRTFEKGRFETVKVGSMTIGRASYQPGWKWSEHVGAVTGAALCEVEHVGMVVSGCAACRMQDGRYYEMRAGDLFYIGPVHDSWVVGQEPYVSLHFLARNITRSQMAKDRQLAQRIEIGEILRPRDRSFILNQERFAQDEHGKPFKFRSYLCLKRFVRSDTGHSCQQINSIWDAPELDYLVRLGKVRFFEASSCETKLVHDNGKFRRVFR